MTAPRIAIDGPAGAGKTAVGLKAARALDYLFVDTGAMYRALGLLATRSGTHLDDGEALARLLEDHRVEVAPASVADGRWYDVRLDGEDVTWEIRGAAMDHAASKVAAHPPVRSLMVARQQAYGRRGRVIMAGRDIGTDVMPDAELKLFLTASDEERARRRMKDEHTRGIDRTFAGVLGDIQERDKRDETRAASPLRTASGAHHIVSDGLGEDEVVELVVGLARALPG